MISMISLDIFQIPLKRFYRAESAAGENIASASHNLSRLCFMMAGVVTPFKLNCHPGRQNTNNILAARIITSSKGVAPRSHDNNICVSFYTVMSTHYIICNLQIVDIYQNIRPPTKTPSEN